VGHANTSKSALHLNVLFFEAHVQSCNCNQTRQTAYLLSHMLSFRQMFGHTIASGQNRLHTFCRTCCSCRQMVGHATASGQDTLHTFCRTGSLSSMVYSPIVVCTPFTPANGPSWICIMKEQPDLFRQQNEKGNEVIRSDDEKPMTSMCIVDTRYHRLRWIWCMQHHTDTDTGTDTDTDGHCSAMQANSHAQGESVRSSTLIVVGSSSDVIENCPVRCD